MEKVYTLYFHTKNISLPYKKFIIKVFCQLTKVHNKFVTVYKYIRLFQENNLHFQNKNIHINGPKMLQF